ncbi:hypothetical protein H8S33_05400 [Ornithinibacillus sp. BX22]|uniref:Lipoprotein n=1 Tax=Ornithinibacillus hominis TaxID=2763055 RepID=A0A923L4C4_9BACI|nr:membrane lipoprotein lipid attachment site-containing protein [Ornithinibacillus hominis]MBC5636264.1 hypothetical protein [Ornithinibacillus hominis]
MKKYLFLIVTLLLVVSGCTEKEIKLSENANIAKSYLEQSGYQVISFEGESSQEFKRKDLFTSPNLEFWSVQYMEPDEYFDKEINTVAFIVENHPLDNIFEMGKTKVTVWIVDNEVIGGWSSPISKNHDEAGSPYALDGKTVEEVKGDHSDWLEEWKNKYKD